LQSVCNILKHNQTETAQKLQEANEALRQFDDKFKTLEAEYRAREVKLVSQQKRWRSEKLLYDRAVQLLSKAPADLGIQLHHVARNSRAKSHPAVIRRAPKHGSGYLAGLRHGDVLVSLNGAAVTHETYAELVASLTAGDRYTIVVQRKETKRGLGGTNRTTSGVSGGGGGAGSLHTVLGVTGTSLFPLDTVQVLKRLANRVTNSQDLTLLNLTELERTLV
jgi:hypothetical protein